MASKLFLTLDDAIKVALEWIMVLGEGDEECLRNDFEQKCYLSSDQYSIGWCDGVNAAMDAIKTMAESFEED